MYYKEIRIRKMADIPPSFLWTKLYNQLHLFMATEKNEKGENDIGVSFPEYNPKGLGYIVRLFSEDKETLDSIGSFHDIPALSEYLIFSKVKKVPKKIKSYAVYRRYQPDNSRHQKAKRYAKRHNVYYEEAFELLKSKPPLKYPYIQMHSATTGQNFSLFIHKIESKERVEGEFNAYGLSTTATVPEF